MLQASHEGRSQSSDTFSAERPGGVEAGGWFEILIGESPQMQEIYRQVKRILDTTIRVLLTGETGTGKSMIAYYIHSHSPRKEKLFIAQNCGALPEGLLESELFGHKRGSFTGAISDKKGLFEVADGGSLFLDEVGEMSSSMQIKLLQVLQEGRFRRVGDSIYRAVDVRIIAAPNKDLEVEVQRGKFRTDLYYRLNVFPIWIPPLRERMEDIALLVEHCLKKHGKEMNRKVVGFTSEAMKILCSYDFPGNVRQLENVVQRAVVLCEGNEITDQEVSRALEKDWRQEPLVKRSDKAFILSQDGIEKLVRQILRQLDFTSGIALKKLVEQIEFQALKQAFKQTNYNQSKAARLLGFSNRTPLLTLMKRYGLTAGSMDSSHEAMTLAAGPPLTPGE
jgi:transcriptional regulator with GAF, ATPase, and Fis domain